jgi:hypothetical protein
MVTQMRLTMVAVAVAVDLALVGVTQVVVL